MTTATPLLPARVPARGRGGRSKLIMSNYEFSFCSISGACKYMSSGLEYLQRIFPLCHFTTYFAVLTTKVKSLWAEAFGGSQRVFKEATPTMNHYSSSPHFDNPLVSQPYPFAPARSLLRVCGLSRLPMCTQMWAAAGGGM